MYYLNEGAGWSSLYADFGTGELSFSISYAWAEFQDMTERLCRMHPNWDGHYKRLPNDSVKFSENKSEFALSAQWYFGEEPGESVWNLERTGPFDGTDCSMHLLIHHDSERYYDENNDYDEDDVDINVHNYDFDFTYLDICYAVSDAWTQTIKMNGIWGYCATNTGKPLSIRQILFLKSLALKAPECLELVKDHDLLSYYSTDINKEIELLLFDMTPYTLPDKVKKMIEEKNIFTVGC